MVVAGASSDIVKVTLDSDFLIETTKAAVLGVFGVNAIKIRADDKICACACWDGTIRVFSMKTLKILCILEGHREAANDIVFVDENVMLTGAQDKKMNEWRIY